MATIASLAIKVSANIADLSKGINSINSSIGYMVKTAKNASPSLKSLEDAAKGAGAVMDAINQKNNELVRALEKAKAENKKDSNADLIKSIEQQIKDLEGDRVNLAKEVQNAPVMSEDDAAAAKKDAYQKMLESLGVVKSDAEKFIDLGKTEQDKYNEMLAQLESVKNIMSPEQYAKSLSALQQQEPIIKKQNEELKKQIDEQKKLAEKEKQAREQMLDKFRQMANDSPVAKFNELKTQLESVRNSLSRTDFAAAMDKLDSDLAGGLGIKEFLKPEQSPAEKLAGVYKKLEEYADKINDPFFDLAAAKQRAARV